MPVSSLPQLDVKVRGFSTTYPWQIWCLWALEDRIYTLSGAGTFFVDQTARKRCTEDLEALAQWPRYMVANKLDLPYGHAVQLMATALRDWIWLPEQTKQALHCALQRAVENGIPLVPPSVHGLASAEELLAKPLPHQHLHNIPLIAQAALATAAEVIGHPERERLSSRFLLLFTARLALYHQGLTEGISYDGYLYNFALSWLSTQPTPVIETIVHHPAMRDLEDQASGLACPGKIEQSAEIGDVEPLEMPFIWTALARLQLWAFSPTREALLQEIPTERLRAEAHWLRAQQGNQQRVETTVFSKNELTLKPVQQSTAALTLATGLSHDDLSVVVALCRSPMNHIQADNGTLLIGHAGCWWITDPGYQQYLKTAEREYTLGSAAHNTPVINGYAHTYKAGKLLTAGKIFDDSVYAMLDLTACYPPEAKAEAVIRTVWRLGVSHIVVCDTVVAPEQAETSYHWHGDAQSYWGQEQGAVSLYQEAANKVLWLQAGHSELSLADVHRLRGSRGACTLKTQASGRQHYWWCFSFAEKAPAFHAEGSVAFLEGYKLDLSELIAAPQPELSLTIQRDFLQVGIRLGTEVLAPEFSYYGLVVCQVNGKQVAEALINNRQVVLPMPEVKPTDRVLLLAKLADNVHEMELQRGLSPAELASICSIPLRVYASLDDNGVHARCVLQPGSFGEGQINEFEYAFYLLVDGAKTQVKWYQHSPEHTFTLAAAELTGNIQVRGFVRLKHQPEQKLSATSVIFANI